TWRSRKRDPCTATTKRRMTAATVWRAKIRRTASPPQPERNSVHDQEEDARHREIAGVGQRYDATAEGVEVRQDRYRFIKPRARLPLRGEAVEHFDHLLMAAQNKEGTCKRREDE